MRRYAPLLVLIIFGLALGGWRLWQSRRAAPTSAPVAPLQPTAPSVQAAMEFLGAWAQGDSAGVYGRLSAGMKKLVSEADFAAMIAERKFSSPQTVAHVEVAQAAYVIAKVQGAPPAKGDKPLAGFSLLLTKEGDTYKIAQIQEEERLFQKYTDLRLAPGKTSGWTVTYQNEKGQIATITLPAL
jgi:hypothetical protein